MTSPYITKAMRACELPIVVSANEKLDGNIEISVFDVDTSQGCFDDDYAIMADIYVTLRNRLLSEKEPQ